MSLLDDVRMELRVTTERTDSGIRIYINSALAQMEMRGVNPEYLADDANDGDYHDLVKDAVICYCKARYGRDVEASERNACTASFNSIVASLLNGKQNVHYKAAE
jgi:hypothetical protein